MEMIENYHMTSPSCGHPLLSVNDVLELFFFLDFQEVLVFLT